MLPSVCSRQCPDDLHRHLADLALHQQQAAFAQARRHDEHALVCTPDRWTERSQRDRARSRPRSGSPAVRLIARMPSAPPSTGPGSTGRFIGGSCTSPAFQRSRNARPGATPIGYPVNLYLGVAAPCSLSSSATHTQRRRIRPVSSMKRYGPGTFGWSPRREFGRRGPARRRPPRNSGSGAASSPGPAAATVRAPPSAPCAPTSPATSARDGRTRRRLDRERLRLVNAKRTVMSGPY